MEGIFLIFDGLLSGVVAGIVCLILPRFRKYTLAAFVTPLVFFIMLLLGSFVLADMNPAREYGANYISTGKEHDPTRLDYALCWLVPLLTSAITCFACYWIQKFALELFKHSRASANRD